MKKITALSLLYALLGACGSVEQSQLQWRDQPQYEYETIADIEFWTVTADNLNCRVEGNIDSETAIALMPRGTELKRNFQFPIVEDSEGSLWVPVLEFNSRKECFIAAVKSWVAPSQLNIRTEILSKDELGLDHTCQMEVGYNFSPLLYLQTDSNHYYFCKSKEDSNGMLLVFSRSGGLESKVESIGSFQENEEIAIIEGEGFQLNISHPILNSFSS